MPDHYRLSRKAENDLASIFEYTTEKFGFSQAEDYLFLLEEHFNFLIQNPAAGRKRTSFSSLLQSFVCQSHIIFYEVRADHIFIVRVIHHSQDSEAQL